MYFMYHLRNDKGERAEHYRMKGIPNDVVKWYADRDFNGSVKELYMHLYNGNSFLFDLLVCKTRFVMNKTGKIEHKNKFTRLVKATAPIVI